MNLYLIDLLLSLQSARSDRNISLMVSLFSVMFAFIPETKMAGIVIFILSFSYAVFLMLAIQGYKEEILDFTDD